MSCQPVLAYADALREAAHDHEPAKRPCAPPKTNSAATFGMNGFGIARRSQEIE